MKCENNHGYQHHNYETPFYFFIRTMAMRQQNMDDRRRAMMNEMYSRPGSNGLSGQTSTLANAADEEEEAS